jgi:hypothetical protein
MAHFVFVFLIKHNVVVLSGSWKTEFQIPTWHCTETCFKGSIIVYCGSFRSFGCSYPKILLKTMLFFTLLVCIKRLQCSYFWRGTLKRSETFTKNYSHKGLLLWRVSSRKLNVSFPGVSEEECRLLFKNVRKIQYLVSNNLAVRILFRVFIADAH